MGNMVEFSLGNLLKMPQILKIPELALTFVTLMVYREATIGSLMSIDDGYFTGFVIFAFFYIVLVQLLGVLFGDKSPIQDVIYAVSGAIFYIAAGGVILDSSYLNDGAKGLGSMAIITGGVFIVDAAFALLSLKKEV